MSVRTAANLSLPRDLISEVDAIAGIDRISAPLA